MNAFTPGPWHLSDERHDGDERMIHDDFDGHGCVIACVWPLGADFDNDGHGSRDANARLIAAAPELLAACEAAFEQWYIGDDDENREEAYAAQSLLRGAIAKATGEASEAKGGA